MCMELIQKENIGDISEKSPRLFVFVGAYGSGKSEVSVHFARKLRRDYPERKILLADLDIINPFYRSVDARGILEKENIRVIAPNFANTNVDVPSVSGEMYSVFDDPEYLGVFDIGGEDMGARILSSMRSRFQNISYRLYGGQYTSAVYFGRTGYCCDGTGAFCCCTSSYPWLHR